MSAGVATTTDIDSEDPELLPHARQAALRLRRRSPDDRSMPEEGEPEHTDKPYPMTMSQLTGTKDLLLCCLNKQSTNSTP